MLCFFNSFLDQLFRETLFLVSWNFRRFAATGIRRYLPALIFRQIFSKAGLGFQVFRAIAAPPGTEIVTVISAGC